MQCLIGTSEDQTSLRQLALAYSLSATFKDCSLFIRISPNQPPSIKSVDLDIKPLSRLGHYAQLDQQIWRNALTKPPNIFIPLLCEE